MCVEKESEEERPYDAEVLNYGKGLAFDREVMLLYFSRRNGG